MIHCFSDLHLQEDEPQITSAFLHHVQLLTQKAPMEVYILGDLFESWIGDDCLKNASPWLKTQCEALKKLSSVHSVFFIHGNRDFLIDQGFEKATGIRCLPEIYSFEYCGHKITLCHGDHLCKEDINYMKFRQQVRSQEWQKEFLSLSLEKRHLLAERLRDQSKAANNIKNEMIMDVESKAVQDLLRSTAANLLIHGHTHRPGIHHGNTSDLLTEPQFIQMQTSFEALPSPKRFVLGDWRPYASWLNIRPLTTDTLTIELAFNQQTY